MTYFFLSDYYLVTVYSSLLLELKQKENYTLNIHFNVAIYHLL